MTLPHFAPPASRLRAAKAARAARLANARDVRQFRHATARDAITRALFPPVPRVEPVSEASCGCVNGHFYGSCNRDSDG